MCSTKNGSSEMHTQLKKHFMQQIEATLGYQKVMREKGKYEDLSGLPDWEYERIITMALAVIQRVTGPDSVYALQAKDASKPNGALPNYYSSFKTVVGILEALYETLAADYLDGVSELIHASVFGDFLEMSQHLLDEGYKDASAVIAGSSLEAHLRHLCMKHGIDTTVMSPSGLKPKKADQMNADLTKGKAYTNLDQKNVTAWLDLRNKAAHGEYEKYNSDQIGLLISGVRDFITRNPA